MDWIKLNRDVIDNFTYSIHIVEILKSIISSRVIHLYSNAYFVLSTMNIQAIPVYCYLHILVFVPLLVFIFLAFRRFVFDLVLRHHFVPFNSSTSLKNGIDVIS